MAFATTVALLSFQLVRNFQKNPRGRPSIMNLSKKAKAPDTSGGGESRGNSDNDAKTASRRLKTKSGKLAYDCNDKHSLSEGEDNTN